MFGEYSASRREGRQACEATPKAFHKSAQGCRACEATLGLQRVALNPAMGCTPCAQVRAGDSARGQMEQSEEFLKNPGDNRLPILKGLNRCGGVGLMPRNSVKPLAGLGGGFTRVPKVLFRLGHRINSRNFRPRLTHTA